MTLVESDPKPPLNFSRGRLEGSPSTLVKDDPKAPFYIATTLRCTLGHYSIPGIALLYHNNAEC